MLDTAQPKPRTRASLKRAADRVEAKVKRQVRAACVLRDGGYCRALWTLEMDECVGQIEWAHLGDYKRFKTRGKPAAERHTTVGSLLLCRRHHTDYDQGRLTITPLTDEGADGPLKFASIQTDRPR